MNRKSVLIFPAVFLCVFNSCAFALEGAGPGDIYGGPSVNRNICTPYHFIPQERLTLSYNWKPGPNLIELEPENWLYWTQGNNISRKESRTDLPKMTGGSACFSVGNSLNGYNFSGPYPKGIQSISTESAYHLICRGKGGIEHDS